MFKRYMGQIMAECDCQHHGCEMRGYCMAEKIVQLEQKVGEVERRRVKWMEKSDDAKARLAKAVAALHTISGHLVMNNENEEELSDSALIARAVLAEIEGGKKDE